MHKPRIPLGFLAVVTGVVGLVPSLHSLVFWFQDESGGHVQSFTFRTAMTITSLLSTDPLVAAGLQHTSRVLIEDTLERMKALQYDKAFREEVMLGRGSHENAVCAYDGAASGREGVAHGDEGGDEGGAHDDGRNITRRGEMRPAPGGAVQLESGDSARHIPGGPT